MILYLKNIKYFLIFRDYCDYIIFIYRDFQDNSHTRDTFDTGIKNITRTIIILYGSNNFLDKFLTEIIQS